MNEEERIISRIKELIDQHCYCDWDESEGSFAYEIYADYRDTVDEETVSKWCKAGNAYEAFWEQLYEWYEYSTYQYEEEIISSVRKYWDDEDMDYDDHEEFIESWIREHLFFRYPEEHFLKQTVCVNITVDTGDENYDYVLNNLYPHYDARYGDTVSEESSLLWLIRQQGYKKRQLNKALRHKDYSGSRLLETIRSEAANCSSHMNALTFFVEMTVEQVLDLQEAIRDNQTKDPPLKPGAYRCVWNRKGRRKIVLDKSAVCGLYDTWNGAGSLLEIELEKDVILPLKYISTAWPDGGRGYSVARAFGICHSMWTPTLKQII